MGRVCDHPEVLPGRPWFVPRKGVQRGNGRTDVTVRRGSRSRRSLADQKGKIQAGTQAEFLSDLRWSDLRLVFETPNYNA
jgi:hypothetical protein